MTHSQMAYDVVSFNSKTNERESIYQKMQELAIAASDTQSGQNSKEL